MSIKTKLLTVMAVIAIFAVSLNLHSSNEEVVFGAPSAQMMRGGNKYCATNDETWECEMATNGTVCISEAGKCGTGVVIVPPQEPDPDEPTVPPTA